MTKKPKMDATKLDLDIRKSDELDLNLNEIFRSDDIELQVAQLTKIIAKYTHA